MCREQDAPQPERGQVVAHGGGQRRAEPLAPGRPIHVHVAQPGEGRPVGHHAGVGDLLSCHTGTFDWKLATDAGRGDVPWNETAAALGRDVLDDLVAALPEIAEVTEEGVRVLARMHRVVGAGCAEFGARFEEGSEHFLAYVFEWLTAEHREVLLLREIEDMSYEEIGRVLALTEGTVKSRLARARAALIAETAKDVP